VRQAGSTKRFQSIPGPSTSVSGAPIVARFVVFQSVRLQVIGREVRAEKFVVGDSAALQHSLFHFRQPTCRIYAATPLVRERVASCSCCCSAGNVSGRCASFFVQVPIVSLGKNRSGQQRRINQACVNDTVLEFGCAYFRARSPGNKLAAAVSEFPTPRTRELLGAKFHVHRNWAAVRVTGHQISMEATATRGAGRTALPAVPRLRRQ